jgi:hypothetical protein
MRQVHDPAEASRFHGARGHGRCCKSCRCRPFEETSPAQGSPELGFTPGNTHFPVPLMRESRAIVVSPRRIGNGRPDAGSAVDKRVAWAN